MTEEQEQQYDELYKVVLVGDPGVGKTNMLAYFTASRDENSIDENGVAKSFNAVRKPTIGVEFGTRIITHPNGKKIKAQIWDTAGQERYRAITSSHYRRAAGALLVYDVSNSVTFENAKNHWLKELRESADENTGLLSCVMLVGNKTDLETTVTNKANFVTETQHLTAAQSLNLLGNRTSARNGTNVNKAFEELIIRIYDLEKSKPKDNRNSSGISLQGHSNRKISNNNCC